MMDLLERTLSAALRIWKRLAGIPEYELQESKVRIPDARRVAYINNQLRRIPPSRIGCDRY